MAIQPKIWLLLLLLMPCLRGADEDTKTKDLVDGKGVIFEQKGRYIDTSAVFTYFIVYWIIISLLLLAGCINLCIIRRHYIRKAKLIIEQLELDRKKQLDAEAQEPSLFGQPPNKVLTDANEEQRKPRNANILWDAQTLAGVLHNMVPDDRLHDMDPFKGVTLVSGENVILDSDNGNYVGPFSNAPISSINQAASTGKC